MRYFLNHAFGSLLGPFLIGVVFGASDKWGMIFAFMWLVLGVVFFGLAWNTSVIFTQRSRSKSYAMALKSVFSKREENQAILEA